MIICSAAFLNLITGLQAVKIKKGFPLWTGMDEVDLEDGVDAEHGLRAAKKRRLPYMT